VTRVVPVTDVRGGEPGGTAAPGGSDRDEVVRLVVVIAAVIGVAYAAGYGETILLLLFLIGCIVAHELGHFIAAKTGRVKVTEFFVGFGPRLWSVRRGETEYGAKAIPLGGYCRIIGMNSLEEVDPADEARTYRAAPLWRRLLIDVAGSSMHFVIAVIVLFAMFFWTGDQAGFYLTKAPATNPIVAIVSIQGGQSPAERAGFKVGDRIEAIDGHRFSDYDAMALFIQSRPGQKLDVTVERAGQTVHLTPTPIPADSVRLIGNQTLPAGKKGFIGFEETAIIHSSFGASISEAGGAFVSVGAQTFDALGHLVTLHGVRSYFDMLSSQKAAQKSQSQQLTTVVALPSVLHQASQSGLPTVLWLLALINISIGIINLMPFFPLDGGRVVVALYEGVRSIRRPYRVDMAKLIPVMYTMLMVFVLYSAGWILINIRTLSS
jgi:membrane-associated protease RseP (regulator of RpoE activity)